MGRAAAAIARTLLPAAHRRGAGASRDDWPGTGPGSTRRLGSSEAGATPTDSRVTSLPALSSYVELVGACGTGFDELVGPSRAISMALLVEWLSTTLPLQDTSAVITSPATSQQE